MAKIFIHSEVFDDLSLCYKKKWYQSLGNEVPRLYRLLTQNGKLPGESPTHYIKLQSMQRKTFHAGINLPLENVDKRKGARIVYVKESFDLLKILYIGGHKDHRYDDSHLQVSILEQRYTTDKFIEFTEGLQFINNS